MKRILASLVLLIALVTPAVSHGQIGPGTRGEPKKDQPHVDHIVQPGENLFMISERYYGKGSEWERLLEHNPWVDPDRLRSGEVIYVPDPKHNYRRRSSGPGSSRRDNVNTKFSSQADDFLAIFADLGGVTLFGHPLFKILMLVCAWFVVHAAVQGSFVWFAAHLAFVKDVSLRRAMRATVQSEGVASVLLIALAVCGVLLVYVGTQAPGKEALDDLMLNLEEFLETKSGMAVVGFALVALYVFLGIRFIPQAFEVPGPQGIAIVFLAVLVPHVIFLYLIGTRLGFIAAGGL